MIPQNFGLERGVGSARQECRRVLAAGERLPRVDRKEGHRQESRLQAAFAISAPIPCKPVKPILCLRQHSVPIRPGRRRLVDRLRELGRHEQEIRLQVRILDAELSPQQRRPVLCMAGATRGHRREAIRTALQ